MSEDDDIPFPPLEVVKTMICFPKDEEHVRRAAPDLLSALRECVAWFEDNCVDCYALDDAREALKKAKGK